jgi:hypothetical protein
LDFIKLVKGEQLKVKKKFFDENSYCLCLMLNPTDKLLVYGTEKRNMFVWDLNEKQLKRKLLLIQNW